MKPCPEEKTVMVIDYFQNRFGIDKRHLSNYKFYELNEGRIFISPEVEHDYLLPVSAGLNIARIKKSVKPTTSFLQLFGKHITRNSIDLDSQQITAYINGEDVQPNESQTENIKTGYVLLTYRDQAVCCGLFKNGIIENVIPKATRCKIRHL